MFTVLCYAQRERMPVGRRIRISQIRLKGVSFQVIELKEGKKIRWKQIARLLEESRFRVLIGTGIVPPPELEIQKVESMSYERLLLKNGLVSLGNRFQRELRKRNALLIDLDGRYQDFAAILLDYFSALHVITRSETYEWFSLRMMLENGASVTYSNEWRGTPFWIISPDGFLPTEMEEIPVPVFTPGPISHAARISVHSFRAELPEFLKEICPPGVEEDLFQLAVYAYCGYRHPVGINPVRAILGKEEKNLSDCAQLLLGLDIADKSGYTKQI